MNKFNKWDKRWFQLVDLAASWSHDPSTKVGAVIIPEDGDVPILGWNGFARGVKDLPERYADRTIKYPLVIHAEANAIFNAGANCINIKKGTIYVSAFPCNNCANAIKQAGIKKVIHKPLTEDYLSRWGEQVEFSRLIFSEGNVITEEYDQEKEN